LKKLIQNLFLLFALSTLLASCRFGVFAGEKKLAELEFSTGSAYDFGLIYLNETVDQTITIHNRRKGAASQITFDLSTAAPFQFKDGTYPGTGGTCDTTLAEDESCDVVVTLAPTAAGTFTFSGAVTFFDGEITKGTAISFLGAVQTAALLTFHTGATYDFGDVGVSHPQDGTITVTNVGLVPATDITVTAPDLGIPFVYVGGAYPGTGGTCTSTLAAQATCTIVIRYTPTVILPSTSTIHLTYHDGQGAATSSLDVTGTGVLASLFLSDGPSVDFGSVNTGSSNDFTLTLFNAGGFTASSIQEGTPALSAPFRFKNGAYPGTGGTCATTLAPGDGCTIVVTYAPTVPGTASGFVRISYSDGQSTLSVSRGLGGNALSLPLLTISDASTYDFGIVNINSSNDKTFTVINSGGLDATLVAAGSPVMAAPFSFKGGSYPGAGGTCTDTIAGGASCTVVVNFLPTTSGVSSGTLRLSYNDTVTTQTATRPMVGTTLTTATLIFEDSPSFTYGDVALGTDSDHTFSITNTGGGIASTVAPALALTDPFSYRGGTYPGTGGTCGATIAAGATCTIRVRFSPTTLGAFNETIRLNYHNGALVQMVTLPIDGTGSLASLTISDEPTFNFGAAAIGTSNTKSFTVTNSGGIDATSLAAGTPALSLPYRYLGGSYPGTDGTCGSTLAAASSCAVVVEYVPTVVGTTSDTLRLSYNDGQSAKVATRLMTGTAQTIASLALSDGPTLDFGSQLLTTVTTHTFTLTNSGGSTATALLEDSDTLSAPFTFLGGTYPGTGGTCGATLAGSGSCTLVVSYAPTTGGVLSDSIRLTYNDGSAAQLVTGGVTGTGLTAASLSYSDGPTYDFSAVFLNQTSDHVFTITNSGQVDATSVAEGTPFISAPFTYVDDVFPGTGGTCGATIVAGDSCLIAVRFSPTVSGVSTDTLSLTYHNGLLPAQVATRAITGTGALAVITADSSPTLDFLDVAIGGSPIATLTLTNTGTGTATALGPDAPAFSAPFTYVGGAYPGTGGSCGVSLPASASCTVKIRFTPTVQGPASDTARFTYFDGLATQTTSRALAGVGVDGLLTISDGPTFTFASTFVSTSLDKTFTLTNSGSGTASSIAQSLPNLASPFSFKDGSFPGTGGDCTSSLGPGLSCTIVVTFTPTSTAVSTSTIHIGYTDGTSSLEATRAISGTGKSVASLILSDGPSFSFGTQYKNSSTDKTFTLTNTGGSTATAIAVGLPALAAPFTIAGGSFPGTGGTCGNTLTAGSSCTIVVRYTPTTAGLASSTLSIGYNDGLNTNNAIRVVSGTCVDPAVLTISNGPTFSFGSVNVGSSGSQTFTVSNTGPISATSLQSDIALVDPFAYAGGTYPGTAGNCGATLAAATSCTIVVTYTPSTAGTFTDTISLSYNDGLNVVNTLRDIHGTSTGRGDLSLAFQAGLGNSRLLAAFAPTTAPRIAAGRAVAVQSDGRILMAGYGTDERGKEVFTLMRFEEDGSLDSSFGHRGITLVAFGSLSDRAHALALQPDGKILVGGYSARTSTDVDFAVARLHADGSLDETFGSGGRAVIAITNGDDRAHAMLALPNGNIALGGYAAKDFALAILRGNGDVENTFTFDLGGNDKAYALALDSRGRFLLGGNSGGRAAWIRVDDRGRFEAPVRSASKTLFALAVDVRGKIWGAGEGFVTSWSEDGRAETTAVTSATLRSLVVLPNGEVSVAGSLAGKFALGMLSSDGNWDLGFGRKGWSYWSEGTSEAFALAVDAKGRLLTAGHSHGDGVKHFALARFLP